MISRAFRLPSARWWIAAALNSDAGTYFVGISATRIPWSDNGLNPEAYLAEVINRMAKGHPISRLSELLRWTWRAPPAKLVA